MRKGRENGEAGLNGQIEKHSRSRTIPPNVHIFSLSFSFFAAAGLMFLTAMIMGIRYLPLFVQSGLRSPAGWAVTHMMTLGFMTMLAMGASFQLIQVILQTKLFSRSLGFVQFAAYVPGLAIMLPSFFAGSSAGIGAGGSLIAVAVLLYIFNLAATLIRKQKWNVFVFGLIFNLLALLFAVCFGIGMGIYSRMGWGVLSYEQLFHSHLWFSLGGWMTGLIITFSFKLLPMFYISAKKADAEAWYIVGLFHAGIWLQVFTIWHPTDSLKIFSIACLAISIMLFSRFILLVRKHAKPLSGTVPVVANLNLVMALLFGLWLFRGWMPADSTGEWTEALLVFLIAGWFTSNILGYLARIVPFLWWAYRFHTVWQKKSKILLKDMVPEKRMGVELWLYAAAVGAVAISIPFAWLPAAVIGQIAVLFLAAVYLFELSKVFRY
jgi:hypothetical protein